MALTARDVRDAVLRDEPFSFEQLRDFVSTTKREGLYVDYKAADRLKDKKKAAASLREYVAAFSNHDGGVLIIGVREQRHEGLRPPTFHLDPIPHDVANGMDPAGLSSWVAKVTSELLVNLAVPPRVRIVDVPAHDDVPAGLVCLISTAKAPSLVPVSGPDGHRYFMRSDDQNHAMSSSLVADMLLGRRAVAQLVVSGSPFSADSRPQETVNGHRPGMIAAPVQTSALRFNFAVTNESLVTANDVSAGLVAMAWRAFASQGPPDLPGLLNAHIERRNPVTSLAGLPWNLLPALQTTHDIHHYQLKWQGLSDPSKRFVTVRPFETRSLEQHIVTTGQMPADGFPERVYAAALYLLPANAAPLWFQVAIDMHGRWLTPQPDVFRPHAPAVAPTLEVSVARTSTRPVVAWATDDEGIVR